MNSKIPTHILQVIQSRELSMPQKIMAFTMLMPNIPADPKHEDVYNQNIDLGYTIKRLVDEKRFVSMGLIRILSLRCLSSPRTLVPTLVHGVSVSIHDFDISQLIEFPYVL